MHAAELRQMLETILARAGDDFSGIGLLVTDNPAGLPIAALRSSAPSRTSASPLDQLVELSRASSNFHDGFHVLSPEFELLRVSQYFSPPIVAAAPVDPSRHVGGRFMAALYGSALPDIVTAGVASRSYGVAIFEHGREVAGTS